MNALNSAGSAMADPATEDLRQRHELHRVDNAAARSQNWAAADASYRLNVRMHALYDRVAASRGLNREEAAFALGMRP